MPSGNASVLLTLLATAGVLVAGCEADMRQPGPTTPHRGTPAPASSPPSSAPASESETPVSPEPQIFDHAAMQDAVHGVLTREHRIDNVGLVTCPENKPVKKGTRFSCRATIDDQVKKVPIKVTSDEGDYTVGLPE